MGQNDVPDFSAQRYEGTNDTCYKIYTGYIDRKKWKEEKKVVFHDIIKSEKRKVKIAPSSAL